MMWYIWLAPLAGALIGYFVGGYYYRQYNQRKKSKS